MTTPIPAKTLIQFTDSIVDFTEDHKDEDDGDKSSAAMALVTRIWQAAQAAKA